MRLVSIYVPIVTWMHRCQYRTFADPQDATMPDPTFMLLVCMTSMGAVNAHSELRLIV